MSQDEQDAHIAAQADAPHARTMEWLLSTTSATLCTLGADSRVAGYPFGSVVPFAISDDGKPFILIASIAAHTKNLLKDPRATIFVRQAGIENDPQAGWRVGLSGVMRKVVEGGPSSTFSVDAETLERLDARYLERVPEAGGYRSTHSFDFWIMDDVEQVRYIAGFGKICWIPGARLHRDFSFAPDIKDPAVQHMNEDHRNNLCEIVHGLTGQKTSDAHMEDLDATGFYIRNIDSNTLVRASFGKTIASDAIRVEIIAVLKRARAKISSMSAQQTP